jgi:hypothetical protein
VLRETTSRGPVCPSRTSERGGCVFITTVPIGGVVGFVCVYLAQICVRGGDIGGHVWTRLSRCW